VARLAAADRPAERLRRPPAAARGLPPALRLQRMVGNRATGRALARQPLAPAPVHHQGAVSSDPYERQPEALRRVLDASGRDGEVFWISLGAHLRPAVTSLYNRFQQHGLWGFVRSIRAVKPGTSTGCKVRIEGDTPSVEFEGDAAGLHGALLANHRFCLDAGVGGLLHPGQSSHREVSDADSLHISIGAPRPIPALVTLGVAKPSGRGPFRGSGRDDTSTWFDAHIDRYASPRAKRGHACEYDPLRTAAHEGREVVPGYIRLSVLPEDAAAPLRPEMFERTERDQAPPNLVGLTVRFPGL
jgi:hypothetical protein